ncbi:LppU family putative lipoprotein [Rhodococcoides kyotonense]|uniref:LppU protein n=1 Tax=Rhodococcoides kyotonense TaxID=398843 RepID=A0A239JKS4_9NOCA|nr:hypothetical protein [Rhodococcus kyotonensis]SNT06481.1 hypothetical protein SAMN05421642_108287 [Rhodococcus kyotonensis]
MTPFGRTLRGAFVAASACALLVLTGCGSDITPRAIPADDLGAISTSTSSTTSARPSTPPGQQGEDTGGDVDIDVEIGDCVELGGTMTDATIDNATCGSPESNYKVIAKVPTGDECSLDADQYYYETYGGIEQGALCLDVDWVVDGCMELSGDDPLRADCTSPGVNTVRVVEILPNTTDVNECPDPASSGYAYTERNFMVCVEEL